MVKSITLVSNGDIPKTSYNHSGGKKNNAISASLIYPRGGYPQITTVIQHDLESNDTTNFDPNFFGPNGDGVDSPGLFKGEEIDDSAPLKIQVNANTDAGQLVKFIDKVISGLLTGGAKLVPGGAAVTAILGAVTGGIGDQISSASTGTPTPAKVIGNGTYKLDVAQLLLGPKQVEVPVDLIAPETIPATWYIMQAPEGGGPEQLVKVDGNLTTKGEKNGTINLVIIISPV
jgi:hypothetical protein